MTKFKELADVCHPDNLANGTLKLNTVYQSGNIAMQTQYHEFAASIKDESKSRAAGGKTAYAPCPKGDSSWIKNGGEAVNGTNCGIERRIPWNIIHDDLPRWRTEDDPDFVAAKESAERRQG